MKIGLTHGVRIYASWHRCALRMQVGLSAAKLLTATYASYRIDQKDLGVCNVPPTEGRAKIPSRKKKVLKKFVCEAFQKYLEMGMFVEHSNYVNVPLQSFGNAFNLLDSHLAPSE